MTQFLVDRGLTVDFLLYPMDGDFADTVPDAVAVMQAAWGGLVVIAPPSRPMHTAPAGEHHGIDEWWDPSLDAQLAFLCRRRGYTVMWVNYVFLSRAFEHAPRNCLRVLDTHDALAGRRELFERHGARPEFFQPSEVEEARGLDRADIVVAIKQSEARRFARITAHPVVSVPTLPRAPACQGARGGQPRGTPHDRAPGTALRIGFIGAENEVNTVNLRRFIARLEAHRRVFLAEFVLVVAGAVCRQVTAIPGRIIAMGRVANLTDFYGAVDVVVAPIAFSTGLKIKVAEALAWNMPIVSTADGFDGFAPADPFHVLPDIDAVCAAIVALAADPPRLAALADATARAALAAREAEAIGLTELGTMMARSRRLLIVVTDVAVWRRSTLLEERGFQALAYFADLLPVTVLCVGVAQVDEPPPDGLPPCVEALRLTSLADVPDAMRAICANEAAAGCFVSLAAPGQLPELRIEGIEIPTFVDRWPRSASEGSSAARDIETEGGAAFDVTPLCYLPGVLNWRGHSKSPHLVLVLIEAPHGPVTDERLSDGPLLDALADVRPGRLAVLRTPRLATDAHALHTLALLPMPSAFVTLAGSPAARGLVAALASWCGAPSFDLAGAAYPLLLGGRLVRDVSGHIDAIGDILRDADAPLPASERASDGGWSRIWGRLAANAGWLPSGRAAAEAAA
jgi:glycosyltransferase involved in cell wall biosynthesis